MGDLRRIKVVHVYLIFEKRNYYFGSISAIYKHLSEYDIGISRNTLSHNTDDTILTKRAIIRKGELLR